MADNEDLRALVRTIADYPKPGIRFRDVSTLLLDGPAFKQTIDRMIALVHPDEFDLNIMPGLGGAELELTGDINTPETVYSSLFSLEESFNQQQEQFDVLSRLLNEQSIADNVTPHMMPLESGWISSYYGKRIDPFTGQQASHSGMDYSGAYQSKIRAAADGVVRVFAVSLAPLVADACARAGRPLTAEEWNEAFGERPYAPVCP